MSAPERTPSPDAPLLESPIATVSPECASEPCELGHAVTVEPAPRPDELAATGFDVVGAALGALVLMYAGLALLRGRRA